ncbi:MAG: hypothetical protein UT33_C0011G0029 [Candidatus Peregrinibacteria bacterium GW2011_GWC2_39_14]|nr:MAG: hypothetical protein UT33_C0011G0029 [Candidatus Peregrinibacteria bacterium GW2011_GWC2_39_14]
MRASLKTGFSFGLTSAIITTLGLMVGLDSVTSSKYVVLGGILTIAIADAFSDSLGIHISQESAGDKSNKQIWEATFSTFIFKLIFALTFVIPVLIFPLTTAIYVSIVYGVTLLAILSYFLAKAEKTKPLHVILEHVLIAIVVIAVTHQVGDWIGIAFAK